MPLPRRLGGVSGPEAGNGKADIVPFSKTFWHGHPMPSPSEGLPSASFFFFSFFCHCRHLKAPDHHSACAFLPFQLVAAWFGSRNQLFSVPFRLPFYFVTLLWTERSSDFVGHISIRHPKMEIFRGSLPE